jgi:hypothetical protein
LTNNFSDMSRKSGDPKSATSSSWSRHGPAAVKLEGPLSGSERFLRYFLVGLDRAERLFPDTPIFRQAIISVLLSALDALEPQALSQHLSALETIWRSMGEALPAGFGGLVLGESEEPKLKRPEGRPRSIRERPRETQELNEIERIMAEEDLPFEKARRAVFARQKKDVLAEANRHRRAKIPRAEDRRSDRRRLEELRRVRETARFIESTPGAKTLVKALVDPVWQPVYERCCADIRKFLQAGEGDAGYSIEQLKDRFAQRDVAPEKEGFETRRYARWIVEAVCEQLIREAWPVRRRELGKSDTNSRALELMSVRKR